MDLQVSNRTIIKTRHILETKGIVTIKDIPDLDCHYSCDFLYQTIKEEGNFNVCIDVIRTKFMDFIHVIYDANRFDDKYVSNYVKKLKF